MVKERFTHIKIHANEKTNTIVCSLFFENKKIVSVISYSFGGYTVSNKSCIKVQQNYFYLLFLANSH